MTDAKLCNRCGEVKPVELFSRDKSKRDGRCSNCKDCSRKTRKEWYAANRERAIEQSAEWQRNNTERYRESARMRRSENRDAHLKKRRDRHKKAYKENQEYAMNHRMRAMLRRHFSRGCLKEMSTYEALGYKPQQLMQRLESQFKKGMSWGNYGEWEIDHKIPMSKMIARGEVRPWIVNSLANLQPMWKEDNRSKGARWTG